MARVPEIIGDLACSEGAGEGADAAAQARNSPLTHVGQMGFQRAESRLDRVRSGEYLGR